MSHRRQQGFSLIELMVVVAMLALLGYFSLREAREQWRSEEANAVANELAGWISSVHRAALRGKRCAVTIAPSGSPDPLSGNAVAATAREAVDTNPIDNGCLAHSPLTIQSVPSTTQFTVTPRNATFSFTPRGTLAEASINPLEFRITPLTGGTPYCIQLVGILGLVKIGFLQGNSCTYPS